MKQSFSLFDASSDSKHEFMKKRNNLANVGKVTKKKLFCNKETHFHSRLHEKISPLGVSSILFPSPWRWNKMRKTCFWCELQDIKSLISKSWPIISNFSFSLNLSHNNSKLGFKRKVRKTRLCIEPIWNDKRVSIVRNPHITAKGILWAVLQLLLLSPLPSFVQRESGVSSTNNDGFNRV